ncbi:HPP family protein [Sphaerotilus microaerophilus]|jgi:CBS domain-containing membrane protein|uniref:Membrane protein n=1 Tax=Sphaerotilus microaerophilus TaxID=2914710 RepID=A0ABM7YSM2_9BURK|nr:HPP family protein [Sphaerotilus sp. FB-5]BDI07630.1 membrane protein [Sphaerotilus sp. FB-5]
MPAQTAASERRLRWWQRLGLQRQTVDWRERLRDSLGAALGVGVSGSVGWWLLGGQGGALWLAAPMGASAVLLFAVPSSPLAQAWPALAGNVVAALVGTAVYQAWGAGPAAAAAAVGLALLLMFPLRCVHPPGGGTALVAVLGGPTVHALGWGFAFVPVGLNAALLVAVAKLYRRATAPQRAHTPPVHDNRHQTRDAAPQDRIGLTRADLDAALRDFNQLVDIDRDALEDLLRQAQAQAWQRRFGSVRCVDIMSRDLVTAEFGTPLEEAWQLLYVHRIKALPVVDRARRVIGIVTLIDFIKQARLDPRDPRSFGERVRRLLNATPGPSSDKPEVVGQIMAHPVHTVASDAVVVELVPRLSDLGLHHVPVVDAERRLVGMVTQSDLVAALYRAQAG